MEVTGSAAAAPVEVGPETRRSSDLNNSKSVVTDQFDEYFDFSNEDDDDLLLFENPNADEFQSFKAESSSAVTLLVGTSCNSPPADLGHSNPTSELYVPYDDLADLEWVSTFAEESFSSEDLEKLQFISGMSTRPDESASAAHKPRPDLSSSEYPPEVPVPGKARSKRPRTAPGNWNSRLLLLSSPESEGPKLIKKPKTVKKYGAECLPVDGRKCLHCQTDKTPQWRTGPMGPKTLCNACGVRFKSGRLVPEYRPASSPSFVKTKHSNSHRKVLELRRQKETMIGTQTRTHPQHQRFLEQYRSLGFDGSNGEDYLIHRRIGPDYGQII